MAKNVVALCFRREFDGVIKTKLAEKNYNVLSYGQNLEKEQIIEAVEKWGSACNLVVMYEYKRKDNLSEIEEMTELSDKACVEFIKIQKEKS